MAIRWRLQQPIRRCFIRSWQSGRSLTLRVACGFGKPCVRGTRLSVAMFSGPWQVVAAKLSWCKTSRSSTIRIYWSVWPLLQSGKDRSVDLIRVGLIFLNALTQGPAEAKG
jgi:hypothetical protein